MRVSLVVIWRVLGRIFAPFFLSSTMRLLPTGIVVALKVKRVIVLLIVTGMVRSVPIIAGPW